MPHVTGIEASRLVKERFDDNNKKIANRVNAERLVDTESPRVGLLRPLICYLSQLERAGLSHFINEEE